MRHCSAQLPACVVVCAALRGSSRQAASWPTNQPTNQPTKQCSARGLISPPNIASCYDRFVFLGWPRQCVRLVLPPGGAVHWWPPDAPASGCVCCASFDVDNTAHTAAPAVRYLCVGTARRAGWHGIGRRACNIFPTCRVERQAPAAATARKPAPDSSSTQCDTADRRKCELFWGQLSPTIQPHSTPVTAR